MNFVADILPKICSGAGILGVIGATIAACFGGWDASISLLICCMALDYISGFIVAAVFKKSRHSASGALESRAGWKGICRKGMTLLIVLIAAQLDNVIGTDFIRDAVVIAYIANEIISIIENAGLMGVPIPKVILRAIDILRDRADGAADNLQPILDDEDKIENEETDES